LISFRAPEVAEVTAKMLELADRLGALVQGDEGEWIG
jgi:hypothetical protein